jgi:hypothetical protein
MRYYSPEAVVARLSRIAIPTASGESRTPASLPSQLLSIPELVVSTEIITPRRRETHNLDAFHQCRHVTPVLLHRDPELRKVLRQALEHVPKLRMILSLYRHK